FRSWGNRGLADSITGVPEIGPEGAVRPRNGQTNLTVSGATAYRARPPPEARGTANPPAVPRLRLGRGETSLSPCGRGRGAPRQAAACAVRSLHARSRRACTPGTS